MSRAPPQAADGVDSVDRLIVRLYRSAWQPSPDSYRRWALERLRTAITFDGALWGTGTLARGRFHTCTLLGLPPDFPQALEATREINPMLPQILARIDHPVDRREVLDDAAWFDSEIYRRCFARYGISHILSTAHVDHSSGLYSLLTLYRHARDHGFDEADHAHQARLAFHLFNAASHAFFLYLNRAHSGRPQASAAAVVDCEGLFHEVQPRFLELLGRHFPQRSGNSLPFTLPPPGRTETTAGLCVAAESMGELTCVFLWPAGPLDRLTLREREVVHAIAHGLSFKQAARKLGVAPSTVANHLYRVYRKLGLSGRTELARLVYPEPARDEPD